MKIQTRQTNGNIFKDAAADIVSFVGVQITHPVALASITQNFPSACGASQTRSRMAFCFDRKIH